MDGEILGVLKEIRDEAKQSNERLASLEQHATLSNERLASLEGEAKLTNVRLVSLEGRVDFLEKRVSKGLDNLSRGIEALETRVDSLETRVANGFETLATHSRILEDMDRNRAEYERRMSSDLAGFIAKAGRLVDALQHRYDDHELVLEHETRITALESRIDQNR